MSVVWQQQAFALDARYNAHRAKNHPNFRTLYIRRRNQLLRECATSRDPDFWKQYIYSRSTLLQMKFGLTIDQSSLRRHCLSNRVSPDNMILRYSESGSTVKDEDGVVPTRIAEASRAIVGDNSVSENYAFVGVHHIFDQHSTAVTMVKFANNDKSRLCCVSNDGTLSICNVLTEPPSVEHILKGHSLPVTACDWSAANDLIVSCSLDGKLCLWDSLTYACLRSVTDSKNPVPLFSTLFHPVNNNYVVAGNIKGAVEVLNVSTGKKQHYQVGGKVMSLAFDSNGSLLWAGNDKGMILSFSFDMTSGKLSKGRLIYLGENCTVTSINYRAWVSREARDPSLLVNLSVNSLRLYKVSNKQGCLELKRKYTVKHQNGQNPIRSSFCPIMSFREGACVVTGSEDSIIYFIDVLQNNENKAIVNKLQGHASPVLGVSFNYDESLLATSDQQGLVILWTRTSKS